jgi:hypothetical protein
VFDGPCLTSNQTALLTGDDVLLSVDIGCEHLSKHLQTRLQPTVPVDYFNRPIFHFDDHRSLLFSSITLPSADLAVRIDHAEAWLCTTTTPVAQDWMQPPAPSGFSPAIIASSTGSDE